MSQKIQTHELSEEQKRSIDNYGDSIKTLEDFVTAVRTRPGMYIGARGTRGFKTMIREILDNAVDTIIDANSPGNWCSLSYNQMTKEVTVVDNGRGLPQNEIIRILTTQHTSKNFTPQPYNYPSGLNGVGAKIVNALSKVFVAESYKYDGTAVRVEFNKGYPTTDKPVSIPNKDKKQGTVIYFIPDEEIMGEMDLHWDMLYSFVKQKISLAPLGTPCDFSAIDLQGVEHKERIVNKDGIITDIITKVKAPIIKPILCHRDDGYHKLDIAFCFDGDENSLEFDENLNITAFSNMCPTAKGTHIKGSLAGICRWFCKYMNTIYLLNQKSKEKLQIIPNDIKNGLYIMISAAHLTPDFTGQAKEELSNPDMEQFCLDTVMQGLDEWSKSNPQDLAKIAKFFKEMGDIRVKQSKEKEKIVQKYSTSSVLSGMPRKLKRCTGKKGVELYIVEGDSALGSVVKARNDTYQMIYPIRGKIINAFNCTKAKFFSNEEVQAITKIVLGTEYRKNFDVSECKVDKVIFLADGDVDGGHICSLLERMFIMYFPQMIQAGMVYKATPPLFSIKSNGKDKFFIDNIDMIRYNQKAFSQKYQIMNDKKQPLSSKELTSLLYKNADYLYFLGALSSTFPVEEPILEDILTCYVECGNKVNASKLQKLLKSKYRFINVSTEAGTVIVNGTLTKSNFAPLQDKFFNDCKSLIDIIQSNSCLHYYIDNNLVSIGEILRLYEKNQPSSVHRYKGLGETSVSILKQSVMDSAADRILIQYTMDDIKETMEVIREYESDKKKILALVNNVTRDDLVE